jgi:hypothetical protein
LRPIPNLEDQAPVFMFPSYKVAQLYPQPPGSLFVAFYNSQGCGGGVLTHFHTRSMNTYIMKLGLLYLWLLAMLPTFLRYMLAPSSEPKCVRRVEKSEVGVRFGTSSGPVGTVDQESCVAGRRNQPT